MQDLDWISVAKQKVPLAGKAMQGWVLSPIPGCEQEEISASVTEKERCAPFTSSYGSESLNLSHIICYRLIDDLGLYLP